MISLGGCLNQDFIWGVHLGRRLNTNELYVSMPDGSIVRARDYKDVPDNVAWSSQALLDIKGTPYSPTGSLPAQYHDDENLPKIPSIQPVDKDEAATRGIVLKQRHFEIIGYIDSCGKCRQMRRGVRSTAGHNPACRERALRLLGER